MEVAGFVFGVLTAWKTCVQIFDVVSQSREYGLEFELCRVKLEVERVRLLAWGDVIGLNDKTPSPNDRLGQQKHQAVLRVLGGIQKIFEDSDKLGDRYGLVQESSQLEGSSPQPSWRGESVSDCGGVFG